MKKISRNARCPCGSGKKYKNCHLGKAAKDGLIDREELKRIETSHATYPQSVLKRVERAKTLVSDLLIHEDTTWAPADRQESFDYLRNSATVMHRESDDCYALFALASLRFADATLRGADFSEAATKRDMYGRIVVRAFFAEVEGTTYAVKRVLLWAVERGEFAFEGEEERILEEVRDERFIPTVKSIQLTLGSLARLVEAPAALDYSKSQWRDFKNLHSYRNDITHPRSKLAYVPLQDVQELLFNGPRWFYDALGQFGLLHCGSGACLTKPLSLEEIIRWQHLARKKSVDPTKALLL